MSPTRGTYTAIRLLIDSTHDARPHDQRFWTLFAKEIMDAAQSQGRTIKKNVQAKAQGFYCSNSFSFWEPC